MKLLFKLILAGCFTFLVGPLPAQDVTFDLDYQWWISRWDCKQLKHDTMGKEKRSGAEHVGTYCSKTLKAAFMKACHDNHTSASQVLRDYMQYYVKKNNPKGKHAVREINELKDIYLPK